MLGKHFTFSVLAVLLCVVLSQNTYAQDQNLDALRARVELAQEMVLSLPVAPQIEAAVDQYVQSSMQDYTADQRQIIRQALLNVMNPLALEQTVVDAYAQTYSQGELQAMVDYYSKPEVQSAMKKQEEFNALVRPKIIEMLDQAVMRLRSAGE